MHVRIFWWLGNKGFNLIKIHCPIYDQTRKLNTKCACRVGCAWVRRVKAELIIDPKQ